VCAPGGSAILEGLNPWTTMGAPNMATHSGTATVGTPAPDFELTGADGQTVRLSEELGHGPVVVVFLRSFG
jgi:peroxiredoxin